MPDDFAQRIFHEVCHGQQPAERDTPEQAAYRQQVKESLRTLGPAVWVTLAAKRPPVVQESYATVYGRALVETLTIWGARSSGLVFERRDSVWQPYMGPQGGRGWKNVTTGYVDYGDEKPGEDDPGRPEEGFQSAGAGAVPDVVQAKPGSRYDTSAFQGPGAVDLAKPKDQAEAKYIADLKRLGGKDLAQMAKIAKIDTTGRTSDQLVAMMVKGRRDRMAKTQGPATSYAGAGQPVVPPQPGAPAPPKPPKPPTPPGLKPQPAPKPPAAPKAPEKSKAPEAPAPKAPEPKAPAQPAKPQAAPAKAPEPVDLTKPKDQAEAKYIADLQRLKGRDLSQMASMAKISTSGKTEDQVRAAMVQSRRERMAKSPTGATAYAGAGKPATKPTTAPKQPAAAKPPATKPATPAQQPGAAQPPKPGATPPATPPAAPPAAPKAPEAPKPVEPTKPPENPPPAPKEPPAEANKPPEAAKPAVDLDKVVSAFQAEPKTPPPPGEFFEPDVTADKNQDGVADAARVGVPADVVPPPPAVPRLPNLTTDERMVESNFASRFEANPEAVTSQFLDSVLATAKAKGAAPVFETDGAKVLSPDWISDNPENQMAKRQIYNTALHQTANAICKRAFLQHLDTLKPGAMIMVTVGGCGAGKGYASANVQEAKDLASQAAVVFDSAGDQNATENTWILSEAQKRGLNVAYMFVHADPKTSWAHPKFGVVQRATDVKNGRMVDAAVFADSYALGARNHAAFYEKHKNNPAVRFMFLQNGQPPKKLDGVPQEALALDRDELYDFALRTIAERENLPPTLKRGAQASVRIWPGLRKKRQLGQESCSKGGEKMVVEQEQPAADDEAWAQGMLAAFEAEDQRMGALAGYARQKGYVKPGDAALPRLNPDGTLASEAGQPPASPQGTP